MAIFRHLAKSRQHYCNKLSNCSALQWPSCCLSSRVFKILRRANTEVVLTLIGRISAENLSELKSLISSEPLNSKVVLDLKDVTLVDREVVQFLGECERDKTTLNNCPAYIREWIDAGPKRKAMRNR